MKIIVKFKDGTVVESQKNELDVRSTEDMLNLLLDSKRGHTKISIDGEVRSFNEIYSIEVVCQDPEVSYRSKDPAKQEVAGAIS